MTNVKYNEIDTKELTAWTSSCGCSSCGRKCQYHTGREEGYKDGISEKIQNRDIAFSFLYITIGFLLGVCVYAAVNNLL